MESASSLHSAATARLLRPALVMKITALTNGPLLVQGGAMLVDQTGREFPKKDEYALCRCGGSASKPLCDGTHLKNGFRCGPFDSQEFAKAALSRWETEGGPAKASQ